MAPSHLTLVALKGQSSRDHLDLEDLNIQLSAPPHTHTHTATNTIPHTPSIQVFELSLLTAQGL